MSHNMEGGCFSSRDSKVDSFISAKVSLEQTNLTAPLKSPSSSSQDTRKAKEFAGSLEERDLLEWLLGLPLI